MAKDATVAGGKWKPGDTVIIVTAGGIVLALAFGVRAVFGGVVQPLSDDLFGGRIEIFSLSIAIQNLVWGLAQPGFGMIADKYGDRPALWLGFVCYAAGMGVCILGTTPLAQHLGAGRSGRHGHIRHSLRNGAGGGRTGGPAGQARVLSRRRFGHGLGRGRRCCRCWCPG